MITLVLLEILLRAFPGLIPPTLLVRFEPGLRAQLARGRFSILEDTRVLPRDDGGPEIRMMEPFAAIPLKYRDPDATDTVMMDEVGFCNPPGSYRDAISVITIGDSLTWCFNVKPEDTWTHLFSNFTNLPSYNLGRESVGLYDYLQILKTFGLQKTPNIVVMNVYEGNDLRDAARYTSYKAATVDTDNSPRSPSSYPRVVYESLKNGLAGRHSYAVNTILTAFAYWYSREPVSPIGFRYSLVLSAEVIPFNVANIDRDEVVYAQRLFDREVDLEVFLEALEEFVGLSAWHEFVPVLMYTPSAHTVYAQFVEFDDFELGSRMAWFSEQQRDYFKSKAEELDYTFIDMAAALQADAAEQRGGDGLFYDPVHLHLSRRGHRVIAEALRDSMRSSGLLD